MTISSFRDLKVWEMGLRIAEKVYIITRSLPKEEMFGLTSQMRRAAVSISSNIAEGRGRNTRKDFLQFLHIAQGSTNELETQLLLSERLYPKLDTTEVLSLLHEEEKMLSAMIRALKANS